MAFEPINTQEEFDAAIKSRLERERTTVSKQFEEQIATLNSDIEKLTGERSGFESAANEKAKTIEALNKKLEEANGKVKSYELDSIRTQVAIEKGLPMEIRGRLNGATREEIEQDAESLSAFFKQKNNEGIPSFEPQTDPGSSEDAVYMNLAKKLRKGE